MIGRTTTAAPSTGSEAAETGPAAHTANIDHRVDASRQLLQALLETSPDAIFLIDRASMTFVDVNPAACRSLGYSRDELLAMGPHQITTPAASRGLEAEFDTVIRGGFPSVVQRTLHRHKSGRRFPAQWFLRAIQNDSQPLLVVVAREITSGRGAQSRATEGTGALPPSKAACDPLTGLPDRRAFQQRLERALEVASQDPDYAFAVFFVDLDGFKAVNDSLGHLAGDRLLREIAARLAACVRPGDMVARRGGDEFTVLVDNLRDQSDATGVAERMRTETVVHAESGAHRLAVTASIGIAMSRRGYRRPEELVHDADRAMYRAKALGKAHFVLFDEDAD